MSSPFPGVDPYLEHPHLWPDVHNGLIATVRDYLGPLLRPRYIVALEERIYVTEPPDWTHLGRPDLTVLGRRDAARESLAPAPLAALAAAPSAAAVMEVEIPVPDRLRETYLEVRGVEAGETITVIELLSPSNKRAGEGRQIYLSKRSAILMTPTHLVEIDFLRGGERMPLVGAWPASNYAILVSRAGTRPRADLLAFGVRDAIPPFPVPLRRGEAEPTVDLGGLLAKLYDRASYDLRIDYRRPPEPPLAETDAAWAAERLQEWGMGR